MGTVIEFMRKNPVPAPVPWQEKDPPSRQAPADNGIRGVPKRRLQAVFLNILEPIDLVKTTAPNHPNCRFFRINASHSGFILPFNSPGSSVINAIAKKDRMARVRLILQPMTGLKMFKPLMIFLLLLLAGTALLLIRPQLGANPSNSGALRIEQAKHTVLPRLRRELSRKNLRLGAPVFMRVFKEEKVLELWIEKEKGGQFELFKLYPICAYSGKLGPKLAEGDRQAPEGFYFVPRSRMNPNSKFHLSFNLGYPNAFERAKGRTGSFLMIHGNCVSIGCYAMGDRQIEEIYLLADAALDGGQAFFRVHCFPFRMTAEQLKKHAGNRWHDFWLNLKQGYDHFEHRKRPPEVTGNDSGYRFDNS